MSTVERVKIISTGSCSPGCGGTGAGRGFPLTDDFTFFFGRHFACTRVGLGAAVVLRCREVAVS